MIDLREYASYLLPYTPLFIKVWGSYSHNTQLPNSDIDILAVYVATTEQVLSMAPPEDSITHSKPDIEAHEVGKFCQLLMKGNPAMIETLYTDKQCYEVSPWDELRQVRDSFLSKRALRQYLGYAEGQLKKYATGHRLHTSGGGYNEKWAYHMLRVLNDAERIAKGEPPCVWKEGDELQFLMNVRRGVINQEAVIRTAEKQLTKIDAMKPWPLPDEGNAAFLNGWLLSIRRANFGAFDTAPAE